MEANELRFGRPLVGDEADQQEQRISMFGASAQALREASLLRQLGEHPSIVPLLDVFTEPGLLYMVFAHMDRDLAQHLQEAGSLSHPRLMRYTFQLLRGLKHCHAQCVVHRDVKPQNILVKLTTDEIKLCDFSLSRLEATYPREKQTQKVASLWYRSPEIFLGAETKGAPVDIWSAACVIAEMATSTPIFPGNSEIGMLFRQFELLGTPSESSWPGVMRLPYWSDKFPNCSGQKLSSVLMLDEASLNLLESMLRCNPSCRQAACVLLNYPCFLSLNKTPPPVSMMTPEVKQVDVQSINVKLPNPPNLAPQSMIEAEVDPSPKRRAMTVSDIEELSFSRFFGQDAEANQAQKRLRASAANSQEGVHNHSTLLADEWKYSTQARPLLW